MILPMVLSTNMQKLNPYWTPYDENGDLKQIAGSTGGGGLVGVTCGESAMECFYRY